jgi:hypothetical protein
MAAIYDTLRDTWGKTSWCCKSLANVKYADQIADRFADSQFIYLYRDGRDVALSFMKAPSEGEKHYYNIAKDWSIAQQQALRVRDRVGPQRFLSVSYEDLTGDEAGTMKRVCEFLGATYTDDAMHFHETDEAKRAAVASDLWQNVTKPVMKDNTRKFLTQMSEEDLRIFESVAGDTLDELGYDRVHVRKGEELQYTEQQIAEFNEENARRKKAAWETMPEDDKKRREEQRAVLDGITARNAARQSETVGAR